MFHIFIVDDNVAQSALLLLAFKRAQPDAQVYAVSDSRLLPAYLDRKSPVVTLRDGLHPEILVLQMEMPFYSGLETLAWIRAQARFDEMFVVMLGSTDDPNERARAEVAGADAYRVAPSNSNELVSLAEGIMQQHTSLNAPVMEMKHDPVPQFSSAL